MQYFDGSFDGHLNSEDVHDHDLPLTHAKAKGVTMVMWHTSLSPFIKVIETNSPSFVSVLFSPPGCLPSLHTGVYLPTAGRDGDWLAALIELEKHIGEVSDQHNGALAIYLRGDFNASCKNKTRTPCLEKGGDH